MEKHWSEDYAQHLRSAYFALVLVCVAAIAIASSRSNAPISPAHEQLDQIWELAAAWDPNFLQAPAITAGDVNMEYPDIPIAVQVADKKFVVEFNLLPHRSFVSLNTSNRPKGIHHTDCTQELRPHRRQDVFGDVISTPSNIEEFAQAWDALSDGAILHQPAGVGPLFVRTSDTSPIQKVDYSWAAATKTRRIGRICTCVVW